MTRKPQPPATLSELQALVRERYPDMSPQFQIAARHLLDHPTEIPVQSMRKVASHAGVQPATLVRLTRSLGYEGWEPFRQIFVRGMFNGRRSYADQARDAARHRRRSSLGRHITTQLNAMRSLEELNEGQLEEATRLLSRASRVHIAGFRASHAAAHTLHYLYRLFRNSVSLLRADAGQLEMELRALEPSDAVVIISFAPYSRESVRVAQAAQETGCHIIAICDSKVAPVARHAHATLLFLTDTAGFFPSSAGALILVEALASQLLGRAGNRAIAALQSAEEQLHGTGAYVFDADLTSGPE